MHHNAAARNVHHMSTLLSTTQAAARYRVPLRTLQAAITRGDLPAQQLGGGAVRTFFMLDPEDVSAFALQWQARRVSREHASNRRREQEARAEEGGTAPE